AMLKQRFWPRLSTAKAVQVMLRDSLTMRAEPLSGLVAPKVMMTSSCRPSLVPVATVRVAPGISVATPFPVVASFNGAPPLGPKTSTAKLKVFAASSDVQVNSVSTCPLFMTPGTMNTFLATNGGFRLGSGLSATPAHDGELKPRATNQGTTRTATPLLVPFR